MVHIAMLCSFFITYLREESPGEWPEDVLDLQVAQILHERIALYVSAVYTLQLTTIKRIHDKVIKILSDIHAPGSTWSEF